MRSNRLDEPKLSIRDSAAFKKTMDQTQQFITPKAAAESDNQPHKQSPKKDKQKKVQTNRSLLNSKRGTFQLPPSLEVKARWKLLIGQDTDRLYKAALQDFIALKYPSNQPP